MRARTIVALLTGLLGLVAGTATAGAQDVVFGSDLQHPPNLALGCEIQPTIVDSSGNVGPAPSGQPDCTWRYNGIPGAPASTPAGSTVPGDGRITLAEVRSGPNPAPLRFQILQQVETVCCYFVSESAPVAMTPNAITRVPLDLPVERNSIGGVQVYDFVAVSAASGTGSLPLFSSGRNNTFQLVEPGNPASGFWYPRLGAVPGDGRPGGGRREAGFAGGELLVRWTWTPPGQAAPPGLPANTTPNGNPNASIAPALLNRTLRVANNRALIQLLCRDDAACAGRLDVVNRAGARAAATKVTTYATAKYTIKPGARAKVKLTLNARGRALLKRKQQLSLTLRITPKDGKVVTRPITLKR